jgi:hypothetical protein
VQIYILLSDLADTNMVHALIPVTRPFKDTVAVDFLLDDQVTFDFVPVNLS